MRKRKAHPSSEVAGNSQDPNLNLEEVATLTEPTGVTTLTQPTGSVVTSRVPAIGQTTNAVDVAAEGTTVPPRTEGVTREPVQPVAIVTGVASETSRPQPERSLADQLQEEEADVAGYNLADPQWFWEMLAEAGYDVW